MQGRNGVKLAQPAPPAINPVQIWMTTREVADILAITPEGVLSIVKAGKLPSRFRSEHQRIFAAVELERYILAKGLDKSTFDHWVKNRTPCHINQWRRPPDGRQRNRILQQHNHPKKENRVTG